MLKNEAFDWFVKLFVSTPLFIPNDVFIWTILILSGLLKQF